MNAGNRAAVANACRNPFGRIVSELFSQLHPASFLAFDEIWIDGRVSVVPAESLAGLVAQVIRLRVGALHAEHARTVGEKLRELALRAVVRHEDVALKPRDGRAVPSRGCSRPATAQDASNPTPAATKMPGRGATHSTSQAAPGVRIDETSRKLE